MLRWLAALVGRLACEERAQAMVEYAIVVSVTVALLLTVSGVVVAALATYYYDTTSVVCLPIP